MSMFVAAPNFEIGSNNLIPPNRCYFGKFYTSDNKFFLLNDIGGIGDWDDKSVLINLCMNGRITTSLQPVTILLSYERIINIESGSTNTTIAMNNWQYFIRRFNSSRPLSIDPTDGRIDLFGTILITELNI